MRLVDELDRFLDTLKRNKNQTRLIKSKYSINNSSDNNVKVTICLTIPTTFTLAVIDGLEDTIIHLPTSSTSDLLETDMKSVLVDETCNVKFDIDEITTVSSISMSKMTIESSTSNKDLDLFDEKSSKIDSTNQHVLDIVSSSIRNSSIATSTNMSDTSDDTSSQWDVNEDLDAEFDANLLMNDFEEQQEKPMRIELDESCTSLTGKHYIVTRTLESVLSKKKKETRKKKKKTKRNNLFFFPISFRLMVHLLS